MINVKKIQNTKYLIKIISKIIIFINNRWINDVGTYLKYFTYSLNLKYLKQLLKKL